VNVELREILKRYAFERAAFWELVKAKASRVTNKESKLDTDESVGKKLSSLRVRYFHISMQHFAFTY